MTETAPAYLPSFDDELDARLFADLADAAGDLPLPCDVAVGPGTVIRAGCKTAILLRALARRVGEDPADMRLEIRPVPHMDIHWPDALESVL